MTAPLFDLSGRVAFVSGAAGHLGTAMAEALADAGAKVLLNGRNRDKLEAQAEALRGRGLAAAAEAFDITDETETRARFAAIAAREGRLDVLVNNAYAGRAATIAAATAEDFRKTYEIGVTAAFVAVQAALPALEKAAAASGQAAIVNIASMYGCVSPDPRLYGDSGMNNPPFYGAVKGGLLQLTRYFACHLAPRRIRCNAISPGPFPPASVAPDFAAKLVDKVPMARLGRPDDLKGAVVFLASDAAAYVTGVNLPVDGGWTAW